MHLINRRSHGILINEFIPPLVAMWLEGEGVVVREREREM